MLQKQSRREIRSDSLKTASVVLHFSMIISTEVALTLPERQTKITQPHQS